MRTNWHMSCVRGMQRPSVRSRVSPLAAVLIQETPCMSQSTSAVLKTEAADIELVHVSKQYGDALAVDSIDLRIPGGQYCCLLGPSGCGKTSTLRMIAGHESITDGDILIRDRNITDLPTAKRGTAMMFQSYALFPHLSCLDNVAFSLKMRGVGKAERRRRAGGVLPPVHLQDLAARL